MKGQALLHAARRLYWRVARPTTLGVRCLVRRSDEVLLVKHTYDRWWYMPGGGVRRGEAFADAARREVREETGLTVGELRLFHLYLNRTEGKIDHVALYWTDEGHGEIRPDLAEIESVRFFPLNALPDTTSPATRRRLDEIAGRAAQADRW